MSAAAAGGWFGAVWAILGLSLLLGQAVFRLGQQAWIAFHYEGWGWTHWAALVASLFFLGYTEGYKAFQKGFSPRCAARTRYVRDHPGWLRVLLAPLFIMGFFQATQRRLVTSYCVLAGIIVLIVLVRQLPTPWRGIVDAGVVLGLSWGLVSFWCFLVPALGRGEFRVDPEVSTDLSSEEL